MTKFKNLLCIISFYVLSGCSVLSPFETPIKSTYACVGPGKIVAFAERDYNKVMEQYGKTFPGWSDNPSTVKTTYLDAANEKNACMVHAKIAF